MHQDKYHNCRCEVVKICADKQCQCGDRPQEALAVTRLYPLRKEVEVPELKFCFGLRDLLETDRSDLIDKSLLVYTQSLKEVRSRMVMLTFYFE